MMDNDKLKEYVKNHGSVKILYEDNIKNDFRKEKSEMENKKEDCMNFNSEKFQDYKNIKLKNKNLKFSRKIILSEIEKNKINQNEFLFDYKPNINSYENKKENQTKEKKIILTNQIETNNFMLLNNNTDNKSKYSVENENPPKLNLENLNINYESIENYDHNLNKETHEKENKKNSKENNIKYKQIFDNLNNQEINKNFKNEKFYEEYLLNNINSKIEKNNNTLKNRKIYNNENKNNQQKLNLNNFKTKFSDKKHYSGIVESKLRNRNIKLNEDIIDKISNFNFEDNIEIGKIENSYEINSSKKINFIGKENNNQNYSVSNSDLKKNKKKSKNFSEDFNTRNNIYEKINSITYVDKGNVNITKNQNSNTGKIFSKTSNNFYDKNRTKSFEKMNLEGRKSNYNFLSHFNIGDKQKLLNNNTNINISKINLSIKINNVNNIYLDRYGDLNYKKKKKIDNYYEKNNISGINFEEILKKEKYVKKNSKSDLIVINFKDLPIKKVNIKNQKDFSTQIRDSDKIQKKKT